MTRINNTSPARAHPTIMGTRSPWLLMQEMAGWNWEEENLSGRNASNWNVFIVMVAFCSLSLVVLSVVISSASISTVRDSSHRKDLFWGTTNSKGFMVTVVMLMYLLTDLVIGTVLLFPGSETLPKTSWDLLNSYTEVTMLTLYTGGILVVFKEKDNDRFLERFPSKGSVSNQSKVMTWLVAEFRVAQEEVEETVAEAGMLVLTMLFELFGKNSICASNLIARQPPSTIQPSAATGTVS